jgi:hypothetical protein
MDNQKETERVSPRADTELVTMQAMAECMDMVRQELVEAGVIDERVPPMFVSEAVVTKLRQLRAAFHVNMLRAYPERTHAEIAAEIDRTCWGNALTANDEILALHRQLAAEKLRAELAEARATSKSQECIELRERMAARPAIPRTAEQAIAFIGNQYECSEDAEHLDDVRYQLTVHDLLSAFDWWFGDDPAGHAAADAEAQARLDNWCPECIGQGIDTDPPEPGQDDTCKACGGSGLRESVTVTEKRDLYTCIGKGGTYEEVGHATGAGTRRGQGAWVYRELPSGLLYWRDPEDANQRMQLIEDQR